MVTGNVSCCPNIITREYGKPLRILHQLGGLRRGGIETWLMHLLRGSDRRHFQMDFFVRGAEKGEYEDEAEALGSKIGRSFCHRHPLNFEAEVRAFVQKNGPYDILHSHLSEYDGLVMWIAARCGIKVRISHSHNDTRTIDSRAPLSRRACLAAGKRLITAYSTHRLAASRHAASSQFGKSWTSDPRAQVLYCGIDPAPFVQQKDTNPPELRRGLGFPDGAFIIGHVGRFVPQKNHAFILNVIALLARNNPAVHLLLVGDGPLLPDTKLRASRAGLESRLVILESRPDIPRLMLDAMDLFTLPSLHEGLPLVAIEAQAAGLPCVVSHAVPEEACVRPGNIEFLSLQLSAAQWADRLRRYMANPPSRLRPGCLSGTPFDIAVSAGRLFELYQHSVHS